MIEENNNTFLADGYSLVYLAVPMHKIYSTTLVWGNSFSKYLSSDQFFNPFFPCKHMYACRAAVSAVALFQ